MSRLKPFFIMEIWKDIKGYEGKYQVSNLGRVKSLPREITRPYSGYITSKERILKGSLNGRGYLTISLCKDGKVKTFQVHKLVAMAFLNHKPCGMKKVVHHIDNNKMNNKLLNLEIVSQRENSHTHYKGTSKYKGVCWHKNLKKWYVRIFINGKNESLGYFKTEIEAHEAYQNALNNIIKL